MTKADLKKTLDSYQAKAGEFRVLTVPKMQYLMIDGHGDPNQAQEYKDALMTLYPVAYKLKFASKQLGHDYTVMPLEGLWWAENMDTFTTDRDKSQWDWTMMIMQPEWITREMFEAVMVKLSVKDAPPLLNKLRLEVLDEGECVQILHVGPYDNEAETLRMMHQEFIPHAGLKLAKKHHEIYLSDPRKVASEKLRTILRQPVAKK